jgi:MFS superfamily sulfate permease-like transporter
MIIRKNQYRLVLAFIALAVSRQLSSAASMSEVGKEQAITNKINQVVEKYREMTI